VRISTFAHQIHESQRWLEHVYAVTDNQAVAPTTASMRLASLRALHLIYAAAATSAVGSDPYWARSQWYAERANAALRQTTVTLESDNDSDDDLTRRYQPARLVRE